MISDVEFLAKQPSGLLGHVIYLYREDSGALKPKVRSRIISFADQRGWTPVSPGAGTLHGAITSPSLFPTLVVCDLANAAARPSGRADVELSLRSIAEGMLDNHAFLMVPDNSPVVKSDAWRGAIANATYIEEPMVTRENFEGVLAFLTAASDLGDLSELTKQEGFIDPLSQFVAERDRTIGEVIQKIDHVVLVEMGSGSPPGFSQSHAATRQVLSERLIAFLDKRDERSLVALLFLMDELRFAKMVDVAEVIVRLYEATASIVGGKDKRYKRNRTGNPVVWEYLAWGMLLLSWERPLIEGSVLVAVDRLCRNFMNVPEYQIWLYRTDRWQDIAVQFARSEKVESGKLARARVDLVNVLRSRLGPIQNAAGLGWIYQMVQETEAADQSLLA